MIDGNAVPFDEQSFLGLLHDGTFPGLIVDSLYRGHTAFVRGQFREAHLSAFTAIEIMASQLHSRLDCPRRLRYPLERLAFICQLKDWGLDTQLILGCVRAVNQIRNRVVHYAYIPTREETSEALRTGFLVLHLFDTIGANVVAQSVMPDYDWKKTLDAWKSGNGSPILSLVQQSLEVGQPTAVRTTFEELVKAGIPDTQARRLLAATLLPVIVEAAQRGKDIDWGLVTKALPLLVKYLNG